MPKGPQTRRALMEAKILRASEKVFAQNGFSGTTMDAVANQSGLSKQNILYYFPGKDVLYQAVLENMIDLWLEKMKFNDSCDVSPTDVITDYIRQKIAISRDYPNGSKVFAHEIINGAPILKPYLIQHLKPAFEKDIKLIRRWIKQGLIRPIDPEHLFFMIWASTQTYADFSSQIQLMLGKNKLEQEDFDDAVNFLCQLVLKGLNIQC